MVQQKVFLLESYFGNAQKVGVWEYVFSSALPRGIFPDVVVSTIRSLKTLFTEVLISYLNIEVTGIINKQYNFNMLHQK